MNDLQRRAYSNPSARAKAIGGQLFRDMGAGITVGLSLNK